MKVLFNILFIPTNGYTYFHIVLHQPICAEKSKQIRIVGLPRRP